MRPVFRASGSPGSALKVAAVRMTVLGGRSDIAFEQALIDAQVGFP
jgi:hypothetical protein